MQFWVFHHRRKTNRYRLSALQRHRRKIPLTKNELKSIETGGEVTESQKEYMEMVNKLLFGYETLEEYDEMIKLLIQLRTPKLSKEFKPSVIYEIMENSLQPLTDEDLRPMSEAIENMDTIAEQLEMLKKSREAAAKVMREYDRYNEYILFGKAKAFDNSQKQLDDANKKARRLEQDIHELEDNKKQAEENKIRYANEKDALEHKKEQLEQHDSYKARKELDRVLNELEGLNKQVEQKEEAKDKKDETVRKNEESLKHQQDKLSQEEQDIHRQLEAMDERAYDVFFHEQGFMSAELKAKPDEPYRFDYIRNRPAYTGKNKKHAKALETEQLHERLR